MNYMLEIIAFEQWLETHYLPISPQLLWYKLMNLCNRSGWSEWVTVDNLRLMAAMQMGREATLIKARDELIKAGLIEYQKGKKGSPNRYHILSLAEKNTFKNEVESVVKTENTFKSVVQSEVKSAVYPVVESVVYPVVQSADIYKQNKTKTKQKETPPVSPAARFEEFWELYPIRQRRYLAQTAYCDLVLSGTVTEAELVEAAKNYAAYIEQSGSSRVCLPNNFLEKCIFQDYLSEKPLETPEKEASVLEPEEELTGRDEEWWRYGLNGEEE